MNAVIPDFGYSQENAMRTLFCVAVLATVSIAPVSVRTQPVEGDPDDPAIWVASGDPAGSAVIATTKLPAPAGSLYVFDLKGRILQRLSGLDRPNNVDVERSFRLSGGVVDIAATAARNSGLVHVFAIDPKTRMLRDISNGGVPVFEGEPAAQRRPMGIALYRRPSDGAVFAILSRKEGPSGAYLWQYRVEDAGGGRIRLNKVREFGEFSGKGEIEAVVADDELGFVYYSDEFAGIHKYRADPADPRAAKQVSLFATQKYEGDREGLALYREKGGKGYLISTEQIPGGSRFHLYSRTTNEAAGVVWTEADATDGVDAVSDSLGLGFPRGLVVAMNSGGRNFFYFGWPEFLKAAR